jgi:hypothetical protein
MKSVLQALVLAERIYVDQSHRKIICGTFNQLTIGKIPKVEVPQSDGSKPQMLPAGHDPGCPWAYVSLTDVIDGTAITLQMVNAIKNQVMFRVDLVIKEPDRLATVEIVVPLPAINTFVTEAGVLSFDVMWDGEILGSHRLVVKENLPSS